MNPSSTVTSSMSDDHEESIHASSVDVDVDVAQDVEVVLEDAEPGVLNEMLSSSSDGTSRYQLEQDDGTQRHLYVEEDAESSIMPSDLATVMTPEEYHESWRRQVLADEEKVKNQAVIAELGLNPTASLTSSEGSSSPDPLSIARHGTVAQLPEQAPRPIAATTSSSRASNENKRRYRCIAVFCILFLVIVGVVVALVLVLQNRNSNGGNTSDTGSSSPENSTWAVVFVQPDDFPQHVSWEIRTNEQVIHRKSILDKRLESTHVPVTKGESYTFRIIDKLGDGICCNSGNGYFYILRANDGKRLVAGNGDFGPFSERAFVP